jgi:hypothetical protein
MHMGILAALGMVKGDFGNHAGSNQFFFGPIHCRLELGIGG